MSAQCPQTTPSLANEKTPRQFIRARGIIGCPLPHEKARSSSMLPGCSVPPRRRSPTFAPRASKARGYSANRDCQHYGVASFETIGPPSGFAFIDLPKTRRFVAGNAAPVRCRSCRTGRRIWLPARLRQACGRWTSATFPSGAASCIWRRQSTCPVGGCWRIVFRERKINVQ